MSDRTHAPRRPSKPPEAPSRARPDSFIGRQQELEWIAEHLLQMRLVAILGPPGIGKTRLLQEYVRARVMTRLGQVIWCDLSRCGARSDLVGAVCRAVGATNASGASPSEAGLPEILRAHGPTLLVLDDLSSLALIAPDLVESWLDVASELRVVTTSRVRPTFARSALLDLGPLSVPDGPFSARESDAVRLLLARGRSVNASLSMAGEEQVAGEITRELGGIPLALELAAARLRVLSLRELLGELRQPRVAEPFDAPRSWRQELNAALVVAWEGLARWESAALGQISVFRGGFDIDAAATVVDLSAWTEAPPIVNVISRLLDCSLLLRSPRASSTRFHVLEPIRAFVGSRTDPAEIEAAMDRHAVYFRVLASACASRAHGRDGPEALSRLETERDNLFAACRRVLAGECRRAEPDLALGILTDASEWALRSEPGGQYAALLDEALSSPEVSEKHTRDSALGVLARAESSRCRGDPVGSERDVSRALSIAEAIGDLPVKCRALCARAALRMNSGQFAEAVSDYEEALVAARACGDRTSEIRALVDLAHIDTCRSAHDASRDKLRHAQRLAAAADDRIASGIILATLGNLAVERDGEEGEAVRLQQRALESHRRTRDRKAEALSRACIGVAHHLLGRTLEARAAYRSAIELSRRIGNIGLASVCTGYVAVLELGEGDAPSALHLLDDALEMTRRAGYVSMESLWTAYQGAALALVGNLEGGRRAFADSATRGAPGAFGVCIDVLHAYLDLCEAEQARERGDPARARQHIALASQRASGVAPDVAMRSSDVRMACACVNRALARVHQSIDGAPPLVVGPNCEWLQAPDQTLVDLSRRPTLARVMGFLVGFREQHPGVPAAWQRVLSAGWPGERLAPASGAQRVQTAVWTLRKLAGASLIERKADGYLIPTSFAIRRETTKPVIARRPKGRGV